MSILTALLELRNRKQAERLAKEKEAGEATAAAEIPDDDKESGRSDTTAEQNESTESDAETNANVDEGIEEIAAEDVTGGQKSAVKQEKSEGESGDSDAVSETATTVDQRAVEEPDTDAAATADNQTMRVDENPPAAGDVSAFKMGDLRDSERLTSESGGQLSAGQDEPSVEESSSELTKPDDDKANKVLIEDIEEISLGSKKETVNTATCQCPVSWDGSKEAEEIGNDEVRLLFFVTATLANAFEGRNEVLRSETRSRVNSIFDIELYFRVH
jgi:hypothetical protein